jgi:hypothetical protein
MSIDSDERECALQSLEHGAGCPFVHDVKFNALAPATKREFAKLW